MQSKAHYLTMLWMLALFCIVAAIATSAQSVYFTTLANFDGADGSGPVGTLVQAADGNFYGMTSSGGSNGGGTVFRVTRTGTLTAIYSFCSQGSCEDGASPAAGLVQGADGSLYGTTYSGGRHAWWGCQAGCGTVFKITSSGVLATLYDFCPQVGCADGAYPSAPLIQASDGNFYGTTSQGDSNCPLPDYYGYGCGTIFKITPAGTLTTLYSFCAQLDCADGNQPLAPLVQASDGSLYGTTIFGGVSCNCGTIFRITPEGTLTTLHTFDRTDGANPAAGLVQGTDGNFYGTTAYGGPQNSGTVFMITPAGTLTTLHAFSGSDGWGPWAGLIQADDGNFYGATQGGGSSLNCSLGCGTVFRITPSGMLTTLHSFDDTDGVHPTGLVQTSDGNFYGTTYGGGASSAGTVFRIGVVHMCVTCRP